MSQTAAAHTTTANATAVRSTVLRSAMLRSAMLRSAAAAVLITGMLTSGLGFASGSAIQAAQIQGTSAESAVRQQAGTSATTGSTANQSVRTQNDSAESIAAQQAGTSAAAGITGAPQAMKDEGKDSAGALKEEKSFSIGSAADSNKAAAQIQEDMAAMDLPTGFYRINGVLLPLQEKGYKAGDYRGAGLCWQFAQHIYYNIWGCFFYQNPGSEDDMLRDYPGGEYRRITAENARYFISEAPIGAVIRLQASPEGPDSVEGNRHSLLLLDKTEDGCTLYHDWKGISTISTLTWKEFETMFRTNIDFGYFKYIKYPAATQLLYRDEIEDMTRDLLVSSRIYGTVELVEKKR